MLLRQSVILQGIGEEGERKLGGAVLPIIPCECRRRMPPEGAAPVQVLTVDRYLAAVRSAGSFVGVHARIVPLFPASGKFLFWPSSRQLRVSAGDCSLPALPIVGKAGLKSVFSHRKEHACPCPKTSDTSS